jgi:hypothetical protein
VVSFGIGKGDWEMKPCVSDRFSSKIMTLGSGKLVHYLGYLFESELIKLKFEHCNTWISSVFWTDSLSKGLVLRM